MRLMSSGSADTDKSSPFSIHCKVAEAYDKVYTGNFMWMDFNQESLSLLLGDTFHDVPYHHVQKCQVDEKGHHLTFYIKGKPMVNADVVWVEALPSILEEHLFVSPKIE